MSLSPHWQPLTGDWTGTNRLGLSPDAPVRESESTASVTPAAQGRFLVVRYLWADEGKPQDGELLVSLDPKRSELVAAWIDSWHMGDRFMTLTGTPRGDGTICVEGAYEAPPGPDWGWRIEIHPEGAGQFEMLMTNISPDGEEALAVRATYSRRG